MNLKKKNDENLTKTTTEEVSICDGERYQGWTESGQYERILTVTSGNDSIVITNLTVHPVVYVSEDINIFEGESYNGWSEKGQYERTLTTITGCDSIITTNLTVTLNKYTTENIEICEGESYEGWTDSGEYERTLTTTSGADSVIITLLTVHPVKYTSEDITIYEDESYEGWTESAQYERNLTASTGCDSIVTTRLTVRQLQHQTIRLEKGWNIFSSWLAPVNNKMDDVLAELQQENLLIEVQDEAGNTLEKEGSEWVNNIGEFKQSEGYKIEVQSPVDLKISGYPVNLPLNIPLTAGWNIISFPYNGAIDAMSVLQPLIDDGILEKVQDEKGSSIENWESSMGWVNGIGSFTAGEGYLVRVTQNGMLPIYANYEKSTHLVANNLQPSYFKVDYEGNGSGHMNINIGNLLQAGLKAGDELATYDGEICVGAVKLSESNINKNAVSIAASASDKKGTNGFMDENLIELRVWYMNTSAAFQPQLEVVKGNMKYQKHTSLFVKLINQGTIESNEFESIKIDIYPNPASNQVTLRFSALAERGTNIELTDMAGRQLMIHEVQSTQEVLNIQSYPPGMYLVKTISGDNYTIRKLIIN